MTEVECAAEDAPEITAAWGNEWQLFVPGLVIAEKEGALVSEDAWVPVREARSWDQEIQFPLVHGPGWISYRLGHRIKIREGA